MREVYCLTDTVLPIPQFADYFATRVRECEFEINRLYKELRRLSKLQESAERNVGVAEERLQMRMKRFICAPTTPMPGTNLFVRQILYERGIGANRHSGYDRILTFQWRKFAFLTQKIPLILMETNAIEAHTVILFGKLVGVHLPPDVLQIMSGHMVRACARTRAEYYMLQPADRTNLSQEDMDEWTRAARNYKRPDNLYQRRTYDSKFGHGK